MNQALSSSASSAVQFAGGFDLFSPDVSSPLAPSVPTLASVSDYSFFPIVVDSFGTQRGCYPYLDSYNQFHYNPIKYEPLSNVDIPMQLRAWHDVAPFLSEDQTIVGDSVSLDSLQPPVSDYTKGQLGFQKILKGFKGFPKDIDGAIWILSDPQLAYLGGRRGLYQSNSSLGFVEESVRPIAQDLFGFSLVKAHALAFTQYAQTAKHPMMVLFNGDQGDRGSVFEYDLLMKSAMIYAISEQTDSTLTFIVNSGNHDVFHAGNMDLSSNLYGLLGHWLGHEQAATVGKYGRKLGFSVDSYEEKEWGPNVGGKDQICDKKRFVEKTNELYHGKQESQNPKNQPVQVDRVIYSSLFSKVIRSWSSWWDPSYRFLKFFLGINILAFRVKENPEILISDNMPDDALDEHFDVFWKPTKHANRYVATVYAPESGRAIKEYFILSAVRMPDGTHVISVDGTDHLTASEPIPGLVARSSFLQAALIQLYKRHAKKLEEKNGGKAHFILASHYPLKYYYDFLRGSKKLWASVKRAFTEDIDYVISGHKHEELRNNLNGEIERGKNKLDRPVGKPLIDDTVPSATDFPSQTASLVWKTGEDGKREYKLILHDIDYAHMVTSERVRKKVQTYQGSYSEYRKLWRHFADEALRRASNSKAGVQNQIRAILFGINEPHLARNNIIMLDTFNLMNHQFGLMRQYLKDVQELLHDELYDLRERSVEPQKQKRLEDILMRFNRLLALLEERHKIYSEVYRKRKRKINGHDLTVEEAIEHYKKQIDRPKSLIAAYLKQTWQGIRSLSRLYVQDDQLAWGKAIVKELYLEDGALGLDHKSRRALTLMDLFRIPISEEEGFVVDEIQNLLNEIPTNTEAFQYMDLMSRDAAREYKNPILNNDAVLV
ncbi:MAG: hypothetical protein H7A33_00930 [Deltaproteobacteria bacterium]|nr:hypothetical protein [Deltaproteobacteria bacterium]